MRTSRTLHSFCYILFIVCPLCVRVYFALSAQSVSLGLLVLLLDCEEILLGSMRMFSAAHFRTVWGEYIRLFDDKAEALAAQHGPQVLFTEVAVCGNCHAVCKKLEHLLKTLFVVAAASSSISSSSSNSNAAEVAKLHRALHAADDSILAVEGSSESASSSKMAGTHLLSLPWDKRSSGGEGAGITNSSSNSVAQSLDYSIDINNNDNDNGTDEFDNGGDDDDRADDCDDDDNDNDNNSADDDDDDDDASILPIYANPQPSGGRDEDERQDPTILGADEADGSAVVLQASSIGSEVDSAVDVANIYVSYKSTSRRASRASPLIESVTSLPTASSKGRNARSSASAKQPPNSAGSGVLLSDFYPNIGSIFPAAYSQLGAK